MGFHQHGIFQGVPWAQVDRPRLQDAPGANEVGLAICFGGCFQQPGAWWCSHHRDHHSSRRAHWVVSRWFGRHMLIYVEREGAKGLSGHASGHKHVHTERRERESEGERRNDQKGTAAGGRQRGPCRRRRRRKDSETASCRGDSKRLGNGGWRELHQPPLSPRKGVVSWAEVGGGEYGMNLGVKMQDGMSKGMSWGEHAWVAWTWGDAGLANGW